jgi:hypothetical protein
LASAGAGGTWGRTTGCKDQSLARFSMEGTTGIFAFVAWALLTWAFAGGFAAAVFTAVFRAGGTGFVAVSAAETRNKPAANETARALGFKRSNVYSI